MSLNKQKGNMYPWPEYRSAWMAGFIDGDGWIGIARQLREDRPSPTYRPQVKVANQNEGSLGLFVSEYGGRIANRDDCFVWRCPSSSMRQLLQSITPFLIIKKRQARVVLDYMDFMEATRQHSRQLMTAEELETKECYYTTMKELNSHHFGGHDVSQ